MWVKCRAHAGASGAPAEPSGEGAGSVEPAQPASVHQAALELVRERGYEKTTVADLAARAGVTGRTFFRYFSDKREVLFAGADQLATLVGQVIAATEMSLGPLDVVMAALEALAPALEQPRQEVRERRALIATHLELRERELSKTTSLATAAIAALRARGVPESAARLAAETGATLFRVAIDRWLDDAHLRDLVTSLRRTRKELSVLTATSTPRPRGRTHER